ncbi:histidine--tRNA ligase [Planoprotostelium fungivorum]|uniref:histidine--tRNA ligase n=1 Tax=Planoprotostelium fungivorum TaxID=1890364 RepID=A0A2P6NST9_9EUKA|nr:histidine--tRNA ligase [Planoprotostelium fungivorum]
MSIGMHDWGPIEKKKFNFLVDVTREVCQPYRYNEVSLDMVYSSAECLETSDVVSKEMYTFRDLSGNSIALRPENTAGIVRAFLDNFHQDESLPQRFFYSGPMFRYERPQKGRTRQFHQLGIECLGSTHPHSDAEVIQVATDLLSRLGLSQETTLEINTLGDRDSREHYRAHLKEYLSERKDKLSMDSQQRLEKGNVLRVLDSKDPKDGEIISDAPTIHDYLNTESKTRFERVRECLNAVGIPYLLNPTLVRGLDYYSHTVFEFKVKEGLGRQQNTILAGGRYDGLLKGINDLMEDGEDAHRLKKIQGGGIGWAAGVERMLMMVDQNLYPKEHSHVAVVAVRQNESEAVSLQALQLCHQLRKRGLVLSCSYDGNTTKQMKRAGRENAAAVVIIGEDELKGDYYTVKNMKTKEHYKADSVDALFSHCMRITQASKE